MPRHLLYLPSPTPNEQIKTYFLAIFFSNLIYQLNFELSTQTDPTTLVEAHGPRKIVFATPLTSATGSARNQITIVEIFFMQYRPTRPCGNAAVVPFVRRKRKRDKMPLTNNEWIAATNINEDAARADGQSGGFWIWRPRKTIRENNCAIDRARETGDRRTRDPSPGRRSSNDATAQFVRRTGSVSAIRCSSLMPIVCECPSAYAKRITRWRCFWLALK